MTATVTRSLALLGLCASLACATTPAFPPTRDSIVNHVKAKGADDAYARYRVTMEGNAVFGHEVRVGSTDEKAPARNYLANGPFEVEHLNAWAHWPSLLTLLGGSIVTSTVSILTAAMLIPPVPAIGALVGCAIPLLCVSGGFGILAEWDMAAAGEDYNLKLKKLIEEQAGQPAPQPAAMEY